MEESSVPANYVTLAQLEQRWIKEQERIKIEKQNQQQEEEELQQQQQKREEDERDQKKVEPTKVVPATTAHPRNHRYQPRRHKAIEPPQIQADDVAQMNDEPTQKKREVAERDQKQIEPTEVVPAKTPHPRNRMYQRRQKAVEPPQIQADGGDDVAQMNDEPTQQQQQKKKKKNQSKSKRTKAMRNKIKAVAEAEEGKEVVNGVVEITDEVKEDEGKSKLEINGKKSDSKGKQWVHKSNNGNSIVQNFEALSVNAGKEGNHQGIRNGRNGGYIEGNHEGRRNGRNGGYKEDNHEGGRNGRDGGYKMGSGSGRFNVRSNGQRPHGRRDENYVWVKKGDSIDTGVKGSQS